MICGSASIALPTSKNVPFTCAASRIRMIGNVAVRLGPSSNVSATSRASVGPWVMPPPNQCDARASPRRRTAANPTTATRSTEPTMPSAGRGAVGRARRRGGRPAGRRPRRRTRRGWPRSTRSERCGRSQAAISAVSAADHAQAGPTRDACHAAPTTSATRRARRRRASRRDEEAGRRDGESGTAVTELSGYGSRCVTRASLR